MKVEISLQNANYELEKLGLCKFPVNKFIIDAHNHQHLAQSAELIKQQIEEWIAKQQHN